MFPKLTLSDPDSDPVPHRGYAARRIARLAPGGPSRNPPPPPPAPPSPATPPPTISLITPPYHIRNINPGLIPIRDAVPLIRPQVHHAHQLDPPPPHEN